MYFLIVSGMSGAGKSRAVATLEDLGYYCVDNLPISLIPRFAEICLAATERYERVALVTDVRAGGDFQQLFDSLDSIKSMGCDYRILFLNTDTPTLIRRYKETRRKHPLMEKGMSMTAAIEKEREMLSGLRDRADFVVDSGGDDLEQRILELTHGRRPNKVVDTSGFGPLQQFGMKMAAVRGHFGFVGHNPKEITIIPNEIIFKGLTIYGSWHVNLNDIPTKLYDIIRRSPVAAKIITHTYSLDQAQDAFDTFIAGNSGKILFHPWE